MDNITNTAPSNPSSKVKRDFITIPKPNNMFNVPCSSALDFFKWWCIFLRPFIDLTDREVEVIASLLKQRWELSKRISDVGVLDAMTMSDDVKKAVIQECGITSQHFYVVKSALKKKGVIINDRIHSRLIPDVKEDDNGMFILLIQFKENIRQ